MTDLDDLDTPADYNDEPDFAAIQEPHVDGDGWQMTPRMAWYLWSAALYLADEHCASDPEPLARILTPVARPYAHDRTWRQRLAPIVHSTIPFGRDRPSEAAAHRA